MHCEYCDPKFFVIYGYCDNCKRRCEPPLFDPFEGYTLEEYEKFRNEWNQEILERKEIFKKNLIDENLIEENNNLIKENFFLKTKLQKLIEIFGYEFDSPIIDSITKAIKIIHENNR